MMRAGLPDEPFQTPARKLLWRSAKLGRHLRWAALAVPSFLIVPTLFAVAACGNIGSDAGIVVTRLAIGSEYLF